MQWPGRIHLQQFSASCSHTRPVQCLIQNPRCPWTLAEQSVDQRGVCKLALVRLWTSVMQRTVGRGEMTVDPSWLRGYGHDLPVAGPTTRHCNEWPKALGVETGPVFIM